MKTMIINDGRDYYVVETINALTAKELQQSLREGKNCEFNPIFRFTFFDDFRNY